MSRLADAPDIRRDDAPNNVTLTTTHPSIRDDGPERDGTGSDGTGGAGPTGAGAQGLVICPTTVHGFLNDLDSAAQSLIASVWQPAFPKADLVAAAAGLFVGSVRSWSGHEGPRPRIVVGPGCIVLENRDLAKAERAVEREHDRRELEVALLAADLLADGEFRSDPVSAREITGWSRKSRCEMFKALNQLDYGPLFTDPSRMPAMDTLTYPGDWEMLAPTGDVAKAHFQALCKRYERAWGGRWVPCSCYPVYNRAPVKGHKRCTWGTVHAGKDGPVPCEQYPRYARLVEGHHRCTAATLHWVDGEELACVWKLEFQRRGAPHFHLLSAPPHGLARFCRPDGHDDGPCGNCAVGAGLAFREWLSAVWTDVVFSDLPPGLDADHVAEECRKHLLAGTGVDFAEGLRCRDPRRVAVYFLKHGAFAAKEYQHQVPEAWQAPGAGPGRFWGYRGLERTVGAAEVSQDAYTWLSRSLRRYSRAQGVTREVRVRRVDRSTGEVRWRKVRRPVRRFHGGQRSGWLSVNDGPALASALSRVVGVSERESSADRRARLVAATGGMVALGVSAL